MQALMLGKIAAHHFIANREVRERKQGIARHNRHRKSNADKLQLCRYSQMTVTFPHVGLFQNKKPQSLDRHFHL